MSDSILHQNIIQKQKKKPKAIGSGPIEIGHISIESAVLDDGTEVITQNSLLRLMGRSHPGGRPTKEIERLRSDGVQIPVFVAANNLIPFIPSSLSSVGSPIKFIREKGGIAYGYKAIIIPDICDTFLDAAKAKNKEGKSILTKDQLPIAATLEIISRGLGRVGISALVREACGIPSSEKEYLQKILSKYISSELLKWTRQFPESFFNMYRSLYGIEEDHRIPSHIGIFINRFIYGEIAPFLLEELKKINPIQENGRRAHAHHQFLTPNKGVLELQKQLLFVQGIMGSSKNKKEFDENYKKIKKLTLGN